MQNKLTVPSWKWFLGGIGIDIGIGGFLHGSDYLV